VAARIVELYRERMQRDTDAASPALRLQDRTLERRFRLAGLRAERAAVLQHGRGHAIDELALRALVREIDHQESRFAA
jgi:CPA1 family monovalent cation:H+ antiporter